MRSILYTVALFAIATCGRAQATKSQVVDELSKLEDQYGNTFDRSKLKDKLTIIYVSGPDNPFERVLDKLKDKTLLNPEEVLVVVGLKDQMPGTPVDTKRGHVKDGILSQYGKKHFRIMLDLESKLAAKLNIKSWSIITVGKGTSPTVKDYADDRKGFLDETKKYFN